MTDAQLLKGIFALGEFLFWSTLALIAATLIMLYCLDIWIQETDNRVQRQNEKRAMWDVAEIRDHHKDTRDCIILDGATRCETFKAGKRIVRTK